MAGSGIFIVADPEFFPSGNSVITLNCPCLVFWDFTPFTTGASGNTLKVIETPLSMRCLDSAAKMIGLENIGPYNSIWKLVN